MSTVALSTEQLGFWLAGFLDGEGCFRISAQKAANGVTYYVPTMTVSLRADDGALLASVHARTGIGTMHQYLDRRDKHGRVRNVVVWVVRSKADAATLVSLIDGRMQSKKVRDFTIWKEAVEIRNTRKPNSDTRALLNTLRVALSNIKREVVA